MKKVLVPIADGVEDIETVTIIDILRRAQIDVTVASIYNDRKDIIASRRTKIRADKKLNEITNEDFDLVALPGGLPGAENLRDSEILIKKLKDQNESGKLYAAICASPVYVLQTHGLLEGKNATCFPGERGNLINNAMADKKVVVDRNCITSQGVGTAIDFALELVNQLEGKEIRDKIAKAIVYER